jgi:hypothetical protein
LFRMILSMRRISLQIVGLNLGQLGLGLILA